MKKRRREKVRRREWDGALEGECTSPSLAGKAIPPMNPPQKL